MSIEPNILVAFTKKALEAFHMKCQRQLLQISWQQFVRNDEVAATTGLPSISEVISNRRIAPSSVTLRDYNKTSRRTRPSTATSTCLLVDHPTTSGNVVRGRPRERWIDQVPKDNGIPQRICGGVRRVVVTEEKVGLVTLRPSLALR